MITIWYEWHAQTYDNLAGVASGHRDVELSPVGRAQARGAMAAQYRDVHFDAVFTSDLRRAHDTALLMFQGRDVPILQDPRLRECDYGELAGRPRAEIEARLGEAIVQPFPGGESYGQVARRVRGFLDDLSAQYDGKQVLIIGHRATYWALSHCLTGIPLTAATAPAPEERPQVFEYPPPRALRKASRQSGATGSLARGPGEPPRR